MNIQTSIGGDGDASRDGVEVRMYSISIGISYSISYISTYLSSVSFHILYVHTLILYHTTLSLLSTTTYPQASANGGFTSNRYYWDIDPGHTHIMMLRSLYPPSPKAK